MHAEPEAAVDRQDEWGNDLTLVESFLALTPSQRLAAWESFASDLLEMRHDARLLPEASAPLPLLEATLRARGPRGG